MACHCDQIFVSLERNMHCAVGHCGHCQLGPAFVCKDGPVLRLAHGRTADAGEAAMSAAKPSLAVWKFASCDGCQLTLLDCEDELLAVAEQLEIAYFLEASSATVAGPYDLSLVEGSITTPEDVERIQEVRRQSRFLVTIGACATAGGIQALRNFGDVEELMRIVYATPVVPLHPGHLHAHLRPRRGRLRAARLPDRPQPAPRGHQRVPRRPPAGRARTTASASSASRRATSA